MQEGLFEEDGREYRPELLVQPEDVALALSGAFALPRTAELTELALRPTHKI